jgi:hypothetical protein
MFEVNATYANRKGTYTVLEVHPPKMTVRYEDGTTAELNMNIQARIWENIQSEQEARQAAREARQRRKKPGSRHFIKSISLEAEEDLTLPGWRERFTVAHEDSPKLYLGDRILYYAVDEKVFFALATVTGPESETVPKGFFYSDKEAQTLRFYPIELEEHAFDLSNALKLEQVELESEPDYRRLLQQPNHFLEVSEDDFEVIAETLSEAADEEDEDFDEEDTEEEEDYED